MVHGNKRLKEGLPISVHKHMLVVVPGTVPEGIEEARGVLQDPTSRLRLQLNGTEVLGRGRMVG